mmetsp:Transcript_30378/g.106690  ORF Transcript_30378/g.106690 Transcript_30378/m.106690 type:complete len:201 (+) Transcript_30378:284-886(+)
MHELRRDFAREALLHAGVDHGLDEEEDVGRARTGYGSGHVDERLVCDEDLFAHRPEHGAAELDVGFGKVCLCVLRPNCDALSDLRRGVWHAPHDFGQARHPVQIPVQRHPGKNRQEDGVHQSDGVCVGFGVADERRELAKNFCAVLRLCGQNNKARVPHTIRKRRRPFRRRVLQRHAHRDVLRDVEKRDGGRLRKQLRRL